MSLWAFKELPKVFGLVFLFADSFPVHSELEALEVWPLPAKVGIGVVLPMLPREG
jgi:hypothetical protein